MAVSIMRTLKETAPVTMALLALVLARAVDQTLFFRLAESYQNYIWYLGAVVLPVAFLVISWPIVWYKMKYTNDITPEQRSIPMKHFVYMGILDSIFNLLSSWPIPRIGSTTANMLSQAVLPMNMALSYVFGTRYLPNHYVGAFLVLYGLAEQQIPHLEGDTAGIPEGVSTGTYTVWFIIMVLSAVPNAVSNLYKEIKLQDRDLDVWYANAWIATWQLVFGIITAPTIASKFLNGPDHLSLGELPEYIHHATSCFFGKNSVPSDDCKSHGLPITVFCIFILFNITYNTLMLYVFKAGSSVLFVIASAARLPLVQIFLMWKWLAGPAQQSFSIHDGFALVILVLAVLIYYNKPEIKRGERNRQPSRAVSGGSKLSERSPLLSSEIPGKQPICLVDSENGDVVIQAV